MCPLVQHDTTVAAMTSALQVFNKHSPGYTTAFAVELYSDSNQYVSILIDISTLWTIECVWVGVCVFTIF